MKFFVLVGAVLLSLAGVALYLDHRYALKPAPMQVEGAEQPSVTSSAIDASAGAIFALSKVDQAGKSQAFAQWSGKLLVINFWATWCAPCLEEMPMFAQMQQTQAASGLQIIGIAADNADKVHAFATKMKSSWHWLHRQTMDSQFSF